jgi:AbiV family abortive infection protein
MREVIEIEAALAGLASRPRCVDPLPDAELADGAHKCFKNADGLLADARTLACERPGRPARALSLSILALEELGKIPVLFELSAEVATVRWKKFWNDEFPRHSFKQAEMARYGGYLAAVDKDPYQFRITAQMVDALDRLKQWGFYVDCHGGRFRSPSDIAVEFRDILDYLFAAAEERVDSFAQFHATVEQSEQFLAECRILAQGRKDTGGWPPRVQSEEQFRAVVLSQASRWSRADTPNYQEFYDSCDELGMPPGETSMEALLAPLQHTFEARLNCSPRRLSPLRLSRERAFRMYKLVLGYLNRGSSEIEAQLPGDE